MRTSWVVGTLLLASALAMSQSGTDNGQNAKPKTKTVAAQITKVDADDKTVTFKTENGTKESLPFDFDKLRGRMKVGVNGRVTFTLDASGNPKTVTNFCGDSGERCDHNVDCCSKACTSQTPSSGICQ